MGKINEWLKVRNAFSGLVGSLLVTIVIPLSLYVWHRAERRLEQMEKEVCLYLGDDLKDSHFWLRHVRNSPGIVGPSEPLFNHDIPFPPPMKDATQAGVGYKTCVTLTFPHRFGIQFKPFLDFESAPAEGDKLRKALKAAHFLEISADGNPTARRWWFLLPQFQVVSDGPSIRNNYFNE